MKKKNLKKISLACAVLVAPGILAGCKSSVSAKAPVVNIVDNGNEDYELAKEFYNSQIALLTDDCALSTIKVVEGNLEAFKDRCPGAAKKLIGPLNLQMALDHANALFLEDVANASEIAKKYRVDGFEKQITNQDAFNNKFNNLMEFYNEYKANVRTKKLLSREGFDNYNVPEVDNFWSAAKALVLKYDTEATTNANNFIKFASQINADNFDYNNQRQCQILSSLKHWLDLHTFGRCSRHAHPLYVIDVETTKKIDEMYSLYGGKLKYNLTLAPYFSNDATDLAEHDDSKVYLNDVNGLPFLGIKGKTVTGLPTNYYVTLLTITGDEFKKIWNPDIYTSIDFTVHPHEIAPLIYDACSILLKKRNAKTGEWDDALLYAGMAEKWYSLTLDANFLSNCDGISICSPSSYRPEVPLNVEIGAIFSRRK
ncbi:MAG: hypothetical protein MJ206_00360 [Bacilli bacterium]|nr:hypothetical protein [Bacilli bacterium]